MVCRRLVHIPPIQVFVKFASNMASDLEINVKFLKNEAKILEKLALSQVPVYYPYT